MFEKTRTTRRQMMIAATKMVIGGVVGGAVIGGVVGYLAGTRAVTPEARERIITQIMTTTIYKEQELEPVSISISMAAGGRGVTPPWLLLEQKTLQEKYAIDIKYNLVPGSGQAVADLVDKRADITGPGDATSSIIAGIAAGAPIIIVHFTVTGSLFGVIASNASGITNMDELRRHVKNGRKIKVGYSRPGAPSHQYIYLLADLIGANVGKEIEGISLGAVEALITALTKGDIDLWIWSMDTLWKLEEEGKGRVVLTLQDIVGADWHEFAIATRLDVLEEKDKVKAVSRFINYWRELIKLYLMKRDYMIQLMMASPPTGYGMSRNVAQRFYEFYKPNYLGIPSIKALNAMADVFAKSGVVPSPPPVDKWYTLQFV